MTNNLEIFIERKFNENCIEVWLYEHTHEGDKVISFDGDKMISTLIPKGLVTKEEAKPLLKLPVMFANILFKTIADYNSKNDIKTENENLLQGKFEATNLH